MPCAKVTAGRIIPQSLFVTIAWQSRHLSAIPVRSRRGTIEDTPDRFVDRMGDGFAQLHDKSQYCLQISDPSSSVAAALEFNTAMSDFIRASVSTIEAFFQQQRIIQLPWFQRAYAWREENVLRLVADVMEAMKGPKHRYSLGHIHLAGSVGASTVALVDGHQRAITLVMLIAVLRDITAGDLTMPSSERAALQHRLHALIHAEESGTADNLPAWRLVTQPQMSSFFERYVQEPGATLIDPTEDIADLTPAERNLIDNRDRLYEMLGPARRSPAHRLQFTQFLLAHCFFIIIEVDDENEAWSMLGVQQTTRLPHDASEQAKIAIIYSMPQGQQEEAARIWESEQALLGNERLSELLEHLRVQRIDKRSTKPLEGELQQLYALNLDGLDFMRTIFRPHANALRRIYDSNAGGGQIGTGVLASVIKGHIEVLTWLDHRLWVAPMLAWLTSKGDLHRETEQFFALLDRLGWMLRLAGTDPHEQETRFIHVTRAVARTTPVAEWPEFEISERTIDEALTILRSRTFYFKHMSKTTLRRLCYQMGHDPGFIDGEKVTVEHILPRKPPGSSAWLKDFGSMAGVKEHTDRLGNLTLLTAKINREADTKDWNLKRLIYKNCIGTDGRHFHLATDAATYPHWTPESVLTRTERLIEQLFAPWGVTIKPE